MPEDIIFRPIRGGEEKAVCELVSRIFDEFVAPDYSRAGIREFYRYANPESMERRIRYDSSVYVAESEGDIAGMIEMRGLDHVALLFVGLRERGIARNLLSMALSASLERDPGIKTVTVNSSLYARQAYERLGFEADGPSRKMNGIIYVPMSLDLPSWNASE